MVVNPIFDIIEPEGNDRLIFTEVVGSASNVLETWYPDV